jgi:hypothetical protein
MHPNIYLSICGWLWLAVHQHHHHHRHHHHHHHHHLLHLHLHHQGFGLSYTEFDLKWATPPPSLATIAAATDDAMYGTPTTVYKVTVTNTGNIAGDEVVLAYTKPKAHTLRTSLGDSVPIELKKLFGFQRVSLAAGASTTVSFELTPTHLAMVDEGGHTGLHNGEFEVVFSRGHGEELVAGAAVQLVGGGEAARLKTFRKWW